PGRCVRPGQAAGAPPRTRRAQLGRRVLASKTSSARFRKARCMDRTRPDPRVAEGERFGAEPERRPATIRRGWRKVTASMTERPDEGAGPGEKGGPSSPPATEATNGERDERMKHAVEAARRQAEERATAEIQALEEDFERERERAARTLEELQRRLEEAEARAAGQVSVTDARSSTRESQQLDAEMRRLQAESDAKIEAALANVESETRARLQGEADRRLTERE